jgi:hypothetical protein
VGAGVTGRVGVACPVGDGSAVAWPTVSRGTGVTVGCGLGKGGGVGGVQAVSRSRLMKKISACRNITLKTAYERDKFAQKLNGNLNSHRIRSRLTDESVII